VQLIEKDGSVKQILSSDVRVGDIILVPEETMFSSDLVLLASSTEGG
jgi:magnesium-transporting ATPase (P-type)